MRRGPWLARPLIGAILALLVGCSAAPVPGPSLPTFPASDDGSASAASSMSTDSGVVPDDCSRILPVDQLVAVLGLPLNSIVVRTTVGVPAPSVGRLERMDCAYTGTAPAGPDSGKRVLAINAAAYTSPDAAHAQWVLNTAGEDGAHREQPVGSAAGVLVERPGETLLAVQYGSGTVTLVLPNRPLPPASTADGHARRPRAAGAADHAGCRARPRTQHRAPRTRAGAGHALTSRVVRRAAGGADRGHRIGQVDRRARGSWSAARCSSTPTGSPATPSRRAPRVSRPWSTRSATACSPPTAAWTARRSPPWCSTTPRRARRSTASSTRSCGSVRPS